MSVGESKEREILERVAVWKRYYDDVVNRQESDRMHDEKRIESFFVFDQLLEFCNKGACPQAIFNSVSKHVLIDISLHGYINQRAYYYAIDGIGDDDIDRYHMASNRINKVFRCKNLFLLEEGVFIEDAEEVNDIRKNAAAFHGVRNRKAYWRYLDGRPFNDAYEDYCKANEFIGEVNRVGARDKCTKTELRIMKELLLANQNIANPMDLFRYCWIRSKT